MTMPGTITTRETFPKKTTKKAIDTHIKIIIKAGAISSKAQGGKTRPWVVVTVWNVIGQND